MDAREFEDAIAACNLLPGPASTQLAIFCAWRVAGPAGAIVGGLGFIVPGRRSSSWRCRCCSSQRSPPLWVRGAGAGAGAAVAAVAVQAARGLIGPSVHTSRETARELPVVCYLAVGAAAAALLGPYLVLVLLACGLAELLIRASACDVSALSVVVAPGRWSRSAGSARWRGSRSRSARSRSAAAS